LKKLLLTFFLIYSEFLFAQKQEKIELLSADVSEYDEQITKATRLLGNVKFRHKNALMSCDSAHLFREENRIEAFNDIRITRGDSLTLTGQSLKYNGNSQLAQVFENVVMSDRKMTLRTSRLDYDMNTEIAFYTDSANIVDGANTLTSRYGYYYSNAKDLYFRKDVILVNPQYRMNCDTLRYNTTSKTAFFLGPTYIHSKDNFIYCENGWYNTETQRSSFNKNSFLQTREQKLSGDSLQYDRNAGIGKVYGDVAVHDTINKIIITGNYGEYHELTDSSWVTGNALMTQVMDNDSLFLHGDTLMAIGQPDGDSTEQKKKNLFAFHHVKLYKSDMQGKCDSLVYNYEDSTINLFYDPVLWSGLNQLTADSVKMQTANSEITHIFLNGNSFIASQADSATGLIDSSAFNQIRGKKMTGFLTDNKLYRINVEGNGQTIYYAKNKNEKSFGVNRADCSDLVIYVNENKVKDIVLLNKPEGTLYPIQKLSVRELRLKGFSWYESIRPESKEDLFR
jgi:lipopolysaccharide export system protein LptA